MSEGQAIDRAHPCLALLVDESKLHVLIARVHCHERHIAAGRLEGDRIKVRHAHDLWREAEVTTPGSCGEGLDREVAWVRVRLGMRVRVGVGMRVRVGVGMRVRVRVGMRVRVGLG